MSNRNAILGSHDHTGLSREPAAFRGAIDLYGTTPRGNGPYTHQAARSMVRSECLARRLASENGLRSESGVTSLVLRVGALGNINCCQPGRAPRGRATLPCLRAHACSREQPSTLHARAHARARTMRPKLQVCELQVCNMLVANAIPPQMACTHARKPVLGHIVSACCERERIFLSST